MANDVNKIAFSKIYFAPLPIIIKGKPLHICQKNFILIQNGLL